MTATLINKLSSIKATAIKAGNRGLLKVKKYGPEIGLTVGLIGYGVTAVLIAVESMSVKAKEVQEERNDIKEAINSSIEALEKGEMTEDTYSKRDAAIDTIKMNAKTAVGYARVYAPAILVGALSTTSILVSFNVMKKRYLGAVAAYNAVAAAFELYRQRVREEQGDLMDRHFRYGTEIDKVSVTEIDENGKKTKKQVTVENIDTSKGPSIYAKVFDSSNPNWMDNPGLTLAFLRAQLAVANNMLTARGHLFLNEVYDMLGLERTPEGAVAGWLSNGEDGFVDFGISDLQNENVRQFIDGEENALLLEFNVDGLIYDLI